MPNWCENELYVCGDIEKLKEFIELGKGKDELLDANNFIPYPEKYKKMDEEGNADGYNSGGYEWCIENWGTKWNLHNVTIDENYEYNEVRYQFNTAWNAPEPLIKKMSELFTELKFELKYFEGGMQFNGLNIYENGEVSIREFGKYFGSRGG